MGDAPDFTFSHWVTKKTYCECYCAKTPGITNYSAIMPKSGTSLLKPKSYMDNNEKK